jgi:FSR family fosmidomycin resistance protein-like MFS transporter
LFLTLMPWRASLWLLAALGLAVAVVIAVFLPPHGQARAGETARPVAGGGRGEFPLLFAIGVLDTAVRMGLLTFLPFLLKAKGATLPTVGLALSMIFIGGAPAGKFACGRLGGRVGVFWTVLLTEGGSAAAIFTVMAVPLAPALVLLPLLGVMLNGTSSVLYGTVPELAPPDRTEHAFALVPLPRFFLVCWATPWVRTGLQRLQRSRRWPPSRYHCCSRLDLDSPNPDTAIAVARLPRLICV